MTDVDCTYYPPGSKPAERPAVVDCGFNPAKAAEKQTQDLAAKAADKIEAPAKAKK